ncbi:hypothetical protein BKA64DRAFT_658063 [Cadophora sp. MPI-SDFR-AT-0126]|nr:hypothetical protein BKA64DRAFT_658063 [Leotiomycetes sp. MPI-SDFR-AT-0126]
MGTIEVLGDHSNLSLLLDATRVFREIAKLLKPKEGDRELKHFCSRLMAHCFMARDHISRVKGILSQNHPLVVQLLIILESRITETVSTHQNTPYTRLCALIQHWNSIQVESEGTKIQTAKSFVNFGLHSEHRDEFLECLEMWEDDLIRQYPEDTSQWSKDDMVLKSTNGREPSYAVWNAAQSLFKALTAHKNCTCQPTHDFRARLGLNTYRKADLGDNTDEDFDFDMFLSMQHDWQEVHVHTVKDRVVRFDGDMPKKLNYTPMKVKHLCEPVTRLYSLTTLNKVEAPQERVFLTNRMVKRKSTY